MTPGYTVDGVKYANRTEESTKDAKNKKKGKKKHVMVSSTTVM
jgi:hypothetical protein